MGVEDVTIIPAIILAATMVIPSPPRDQPDQPPAKVEVKAAPPKGRKVVRGSATWYDYRPGHAAAGPALRRALGRGWRGTKVTVRSLAGEKVTVKLTDWCLCRGDRVIDLDVRSFARLADPSRGVIKVTVNR
jgi:rare lipoprotein A (peptidoglycan hydrolase)